MTDQAKRKTLKNIAAFGAGTAAIAGYQGVLAHGEFASKTSALANNGTSLAAKPGDEGLIDIHIGSRLSAITNDLEVVITNTSANEAIITAMTPAEINTVRGRFDFDALFESGELRLGAGESIRVPIQHHTVVLDGSSTDKRTTELTQSLRRSVSFITNGDSFAAITFAGFANFA